MIKNKELKIFSIKKSFRQMETLLKEGPFFNRSIEEGSCKSQSLLKKGRKKTGKGSKKGF